MKVDSRFIDAYRKMLSAIIDYRDYQHSGDPFEEDARVMREMGIDDLERSGEIGKYEEMLKELEGTTIPSLPWQPVTEESEWDEEWSYLILYKHGWTDRIFWSGIENQWVNNCLVGGEYEKIDFTLVSRRIKIIMPEVD